MKKSYILAGFVLAGTCSFAQVTNASKVSRTAKAAYSRTEVRQTRPVVQNIEKAEGDILWSDGFSTPANWTMTTVAGTNGSWTIAAALPAGLAAQTATYGFATTLPTPPFAYIDSDGPGAAATQNASLTTTGVIDLSAQGMSAVSVVFKNIYRHFQELNFVAISNDNGVTWIEQAINAVPEVPVNTNSANPENESLLFAAPVGGWSANAKLRFRYEGAYDWFWAVDDVSIQVPFNNNIQFLRVNPIAVSTQIEAEYYTIPTSQLTAFPGHTFQGMIKNIGAAAQPTVRFGAVSGVYSGLSGAGITTPLSLASLALDTFDIATPYMAVAGVNAVTCLATILPGPDSDAADNTITLAGFNVGGVEYGRDNGVFDSRITGFAGTGNEVDGFGNTMEIFASQSVGSVNVYIPTQGTAFTETDISWRVDLFDGTVWNTVAVGTPFIVTVANPSAGTWVQIPIQGGTPYVIPAGSIIRLFVTRLDNGTATFACGMAQAVKDQVVGVQADGTFIGLSDPSAIMVRLSSKSFLGLEEGGSVIDATVYPNPAVNSAIVTVNANEAIITLTDLAGKAISTASVVANAAGTIEYEISTETVANGTYLVNITSNGASTTKKLVVKK